MKCTKKKRCEFCRRWFLPDYRTSEDQYSCTSRLCRKMRRLKTYREWALRNPNYDECRREKIRLWAKNFPSYWKKWRKNHPNYRRRERKRINSKPDPQKTSAKRNTRPQILVERFYRTLLNLNENVAKQTTILRRTDSLFRNYLGNFLNSSSQNKAV